MGDKFSVHPESLLRASTRFSTEADQLSAALTQLERTLGSLGDVSGGDDQGREFARGYDPSAVTIEQALQNLTKGLADIARGLEVMGINYLGSDAAGQVRKSE